jgi:hypothetical protein
MFAAIPRPLVADDCAARADSVDAPLSLIVRNVLALANCYIYCGWSRFAKPLIFHGNSPPAYSYCYRFRR